MFFHNVLWRSFTVSTPMAVDYKKESVELIPVHLLKVVERPDQNKRYNAPHLDSMGSMHKKRA